MRIQGAAPAPEKHHEPSKVCNTDKSVAKPDLQTTLPRLIPNSPLRRTSPFFTRPRASRPFHTGAPYSYLRLMHPLLSHCFCGKITRQVNIVSATAIFTADKSFRLRRPHFCRRGLYPVLSTLEEIPPTDKRDLFLLPASENVRAISLSRRGHFLNRGAEVSVKRLTAGSRRIRNTPTGKEEEVRTSKVPQMKPNRLRDRNPLWQREPVERRRPQLESQADSHRTHLATTGKRLTVGA